MKTKKLLNKKGFSLIKLIVVICILGILAAIAIPAYSIYKENAAIDADCATCKTIYDAALIARASGKTVTDGAISDSSNKAVYELLNSSVSLSPQAGGSYAISKNATTGAILVQTGISGVGYPSKKS